MMMLMNPILAAADTPKKEYRLQSSAYSLTLETSLESKMKDCNSLFGEGATIFDMSFVAEFPTIEAFNQALMGVFFKNAQAAFFVSYKGSDDPGTTTQTEKYAIVIKPENPNLDDPHKDLPTIDEFGNARVVALHQGEAQLLCSVPVKSYDGKKEYVPKEDAAQSKNPFTLVRVSLLFMVLGMAVVMRRRSTATDIFARPTSMLQDVYSNVWDPSGGGSDNHHGSSLLGGGGGGGGGDGHDCELSYNPVSIQGLV